MELTKVKLGDYLDDFGDGIHGTPNYDENGEYYFINGNNLDNGAIFIDSETKRISSDEYESIKRNLNNRTLLLSINGTLGRLAYYNGENIALGKSACFLNFKENTDRRYFRYILEMKDFKQYMFKVASGSTIKNFSPRQTAEYEFFAPKIEDQKKIACVLSALDDKIALNKKMNQKLEVMAKRLYDYWFVQYDFPDKNGRPYKTTGGPMTYNPTLKREIPVGWEVSSFSDFGFFKNGINYDKNEIGDETVKIVNVRNISDSTTYFNIDELDDITLKSDDIQKFVATPKDILLARSGSPGATRLLPQTDKKIIYCGFIIRYQLNEQDLDKQLYLFHVLKGYEQVTSTQSAGSILKNISQDTLNALTVVMPQSSILDAFNKKIAPIYSMLRKNISELNKLTVLRDKLLPLLMNGQVEVK